MFTCVSKLVFASWKSAGLFVVRIGNKAIKCATDLLWLYEIYAILRKFFQQKLRNCETLLQWHEMCVNMTEKY